MSLGIISQASLLSLVELTLKDTRGRRILHKRERLYISIEAD